MTINFTIDGAVQPKERPRTTRINGQIRAYTPRKTKEYEQRVKAAYGAKYRFYDDDYISIHITAYYPIPKSTSNAKREAMMTGKVRPARRPDLDNIAKAICDALNGEAYKDDSQIVRLTVEKWYSFLPRAEVRIEDVKW